MQPVLKNTLSSGSQRECRFYDIIIDFLQKSSHVHWTKNGNFYRNFMIFYSLKWQAARRAFLQPLFEKITNALMQQPTRTVFLQPLFKKNTNPLKWQPARMVKKGNSSKEFFSLIGRQEDSPKGATFSKNYFACYCVE